MPGSKTGKHSNPPIRGHKLLAEGRSFREYDHFGELIDDYAGGCECGAIPLDWPNVSINETKRWHREHKAALRAVGPVAS